MVRSMRWLILLVVCMLAQPAFAADLTWLTDLEKAEAQARAERKFVLLFFNGSDWCPPCIAMHRKVFGSPEFAEYASKHLVLVDVDFPSKKPQSEEQKKANLELKKRFNVGKRWGDGFPTVVLLNGAGETVYQEKGYGGEPPSEVIGRLQRHKK